MVRRMVAAMMLESGRGIGLVALMLAYQLAQRPTLQWLLFPHKGGGGSLDGPDLVPPLFSLFAEDDVVAALTLPGAVVQGASWQEYVHADLCPHRWAQLPAMGGQFCAAIGSTGGAWGPTFLLCVPGGPGGGANHLM